MKKLSFLISAIIFVCSALTFSAESVPVPVGLARIVAVDQFPQLRDERMLQASSYDRTGGNNDGFDGEFSTIRTEGDEFVFFEQNQPGVVYRFWTASYGGNIRVYFDGAKEPAYFAPINEFLAGSVEPLIKPLCQFVSGGLTCYFPLEYEKSIKMTLDEKPLFFQIDYAATEHAEKLISATPQNLAARRQEIDAAADLLSNRGKPLTPRDSTLINEFKAAISPGEEKALWEMNTGGTVNEFYISSAGLDAKTMKDLRIRMYWDGEDTPAVDASLLRLFAMDFEIPTYRPLFVGHKKERFYFYFPMPFRKGAKITLENQTGDILPVSGMVVFRPGEMPDDYGYFHAASRRMVSEDGQPIVINDIKSGGPGHWVGSAVSVMRKKGMDSDFHYLEGDERVYIDGEEAPIWSGTGSEDYFNGGWYFSSGDYFARSFYGAPVMKNSRSRTVMYRFHFTDAIPFKESIHFNIEHGSTNSEPGCLYDVVGYWYQMAPGKTGL